MLPTSELMNMTHFQMEMEIMPIETLSFRIQLTQLSI